MTEADLHGLFRGAMATATVGGGDDTGLGAVAVVDAGAEPSPSTDPTLDPDDAERLYPALASLFRSTRLIEILSEVHRGGEGGGGPAGPNGLPDNLPPRSASEGGAALKVQRNRGGAFPLHVDNPGPPCRRRLTLISYLTADRRQGDGGELVLRPWLEAPVVVAS